tara:strand:- start:78 stop:491 length:414 start_codon:yes stop_codon:yes gene_type:complete
MIKEKIVVILFFIIVSSVLLDIFLVLNPSIKLFSSTKKMKVVTNDETLKTNNTHSYRQIPLSINGWGSDIFHDRSNIYNNWFELTGITQFEGKYKAIVNGEILSEMDRVRGFTVIKINDSKVVLKRNEYIVTLKLEE